MGSKLVSYDLHDAETWEYSVLIDEIRTLNGVQIQESVWAVPYADDATKLAERLAPYLHSNCRLHILSYDNVDVYNYNSIDQARIRETIGTKTTLVHFAWATKLPRKQ